MDVNALIGRKVIQGGFKGNGEGTIIAVEGDIISVEFNGVVKKFSMEFFIKSLTFDNDETRELMERAIDEAKAAKAAAEAAKKDKAEAARAIAEKRDRQRNHNRGEHEEPSFERLTNDRKYFIVFQNNTFDIESRGNYLWAPVSDARGIWRHYWKRLTQVRDGDVIFHCRGGEIQAVSVTKGSCYDQVAPIDPVYRTNWGAMGKMVDTIYSLIASTIRISDYRAQIMAIYPVGSHYAPFDRNGNGVQGYLFGLDTDLATTFLNDIVKKNSGWHI